ncbi:MAG: tail fiber domain-containing protein [Plesiomonas shigelloides]
MSSQDLNDAIKSINQSASLANATSDFFEKVISGDKYTTVKNPVDGSDTPTVQKMVYDQYSKDINQIQQDVSDSEAAANRAEAAAGVVGPQVRESLRRSYAEAGFNLVDGSFEDGATITSNNDVLLRNANGIAYSYLGSIPHSVSPESVPDDVDWVDNSLSKNSFTQYGQGAVKRTAESKMAERISAEDFGGKGDGVNNDLDALRKAQSIAGSVGLMGGRTYYFGDKYDAPNDPTFIAKGAGNLKWGNDVLSGYDLKIDPNYQNISITPASWFRATRKNEAVSPLYPPYAPPGRGNDLFSIFNTTLSFGSGLNDKTKKVRQVTAVGSNIGLFPIHWELVDAYGQDSMMFAQYAQRSTAIGTETFIWAGATSKQYLIDTNHDWWRNTPPNQWTVGNNAYEKAVPGIGARIDSYSDYATSYNDFVHNVALGRDAGGHLIKGDGNVFIGYSCAGEMMKGNNNIGIGLNALRYSGFSDKLIAIGRWAGSASCDGYWSVMIGDSAVKDANGVVRTVAIGNETGAGASKVIGSVLLGNDSGKYPGEELINKLIISNSDSKQPLISGDFATQDVGINTPWNARRARLHIRYTDSGSSLIPDPGVLIEGANTAACTIETVDTGYGGYYFADTSSTKSGGMEYSHPSNSLNFLSNGTAKLRLESAGHLVPYPSDNTQNLGKSASRWGVVYAGTGAINTSDANEKTAPVQITDAVLDAWGDVQLISFRWLESIRSKGEDAARWHFGVIAQQIRDAFVAHGLDGTTYGLLCYDKWDDEYEPVFANREVVVTHKNTDPLTGEDVESHSIEIESYDTGERRLVLPAGERWGVRPDQCLFLEAAYQRRNYERLLKRVESLEKVRI